MKLNLGKTKDFARLATRGAQGFDSFFLEFEVKGHAITASTPGIEKEQ